MDRAAETAVVISRLTYSNNDINFLSLNGDQHPISPSEISTGL